MRVQNDLSKEGTFRLRSEGGTIDEAGGRGMCEGRKGQCSWSLVSRRESPGEKSRMPTAVEGI